MGEVEYLSDEVEEPEELDNVLDTTTFSKSYLDSFSFSGNIDSVEDMNITDTLILDTLIETLEVQLKWMKLLRSRI